jgi:hypothetical protein
LNLIAFYYLLAIVIIILGLFIAKTRGWKEVNKWNCLEETLKRALKIQH